MEEPKQSARITPQMVFELARKWRGAALRHRRLAALSFLGVFLGAVAAAVVMPLRYQAETKLLVKHERQDPIVTAEANITMSQMPSLVTDMELNSEVELIRSRDLIEKVVVECGLQAGVSQKSWRSLFGRRKYGTEAEVIAAAGRQLEQNLRIEPLPKTNLISMTYDSGKADQSARVLTTLVNLYLEKHVAVHRPVGAFTFFEQQTKQYEKQLAAAQERLLAYSQKTGVIEPGTEKQGALQKQMQFDAELKQTRAAISETQQRIAQLETQSSTVPKRLTTQVRNSDNPQLMGQLKSTLLTLELKRTELLQKFDPSYRLVQEVETQIAQTRAAIENAGKAQLREETTDQNPTYEWVGSELAKAHSDLAAFQARAEALTRNVQMYRAAASDLDGKEVVDQSLQRDVKAAEANYLLYLHKQEEARISEALDRSQIVNVAVAEPAMVPMQPVRPRSLVVALGFLLALLVSGGSVIAAEYLDPSLGTSDELKEFLDVPLLASVSGQGQ
jgi:uncharacterized protein involved in exopolysaccharide biosynthesis